MKAVVVCLFLLCVSTMMSIGETNEVTLALNFPYTEMLRDEWFDFSITISNKTDNAIPILEDPRDAIASQMIFDLKTIKPYRGSSYSFDDGDWKRKKFLAACHFSTNLPPGGSHTWKVVWGYCDIHGAIAEYGVTNMAVRCLLSTNSWVSSNSVTLSFVSGDNKTVLFDPDNGTPQPDDAFDDKLYKIRISGKDYLFNSLQQRICELHGGETPLFVSSTNHILKITFPTARRTYLYNTEFPAVTAIEFEL